MSEAKFPHCVHLHGDVYLVPLAMIKPAPAVQDAVPGQVTYGNSRKYKVKGKVVGRGLDPDEMDSLGDSILGIHMMDYPLVRPKDDHYQIVNGERRWRRIKKAVAEKQTCVGEDGKPTTADKEYELIKCHIREMSDLEAYQYSSQLVSVDHGPISKACLAKYLRDCGVKNADIMKAVRCKEKWLADTMQIMGLDEFCLDAFLEEKITRGMALRYAKEKEVPKRVEMCKKDITQVQHEHEERLEVSNQKLTEAMRDLQVSLANEMIAENSGEHVEEKKQEVEDAKKKVERAKKDKEKVEHEPVVVTGRKSVSRQHNQVGDKFLTKRRMEKEWVLPLEQVIHAGGTDKSGEDLGVDVEDAKFVLSLWKMIMKGDGDIMKALRQRGRKHACPHAHHHEGTAKCRVEEPAAV